MAATAASEGRGQEQQQQQQRQQQQRQSQGQQQLLMLFCEAAGGWLMQVPRLFPGTVCDRRSSCAVVVMIASPRHALLPYIFAHSVPTPLTPYLSTRFSPTCLLDPPSPYLSALFLLSNVKYCEHLPAQIANKTASTAGSPARGRPFLRQ